MQFSFLRYHVEKKLQKVQKLKLPVFVIISSTCSLSEMEVKPPPPSVTLYKKYKCSKCAYSTDKTTHFRVHAACHGTTREFACDQCDYRLVEENKVFI